MDKRVLYTTLVSMGLVLGYLALFPPKKPPAQQQQQTQAQQVPTANPASAQAAADATKEQPAAKPEAGKAEGDKAAGPPAPPAAKPAPTEATLEQPKEFKATFTSEGAAPTSWVLLGPQYKEDKPKESNKKADQIDLVRTHAPNLPLTMSILKESAVYLPIDAAWKEEPRGADGALVYTWENEAARVTKRFLPQPGSYAVKVDFTVENKTDKQQWYFFQVQMHGWQDPTVKPGGFMSRPVSQTVGACYVDGKTHKGTLDDLLKVKDGKAEGQIDQLGDVTWVGVHEQYFLQGVALAKSVEEKDKRRCNVYAGADGSIASIMSVARRDVAPHGKTTYEMAAFMGPKILSQLDAVTVGGQSAHFGDVMEYRIWGLTEWLARPMLAVLKAIHFVLPSWGFAIIVLTILLKLLTWFPTQSSMKSMKAMAKLKPQMDKLKERFGDDKNALNMATMELYRKEGVNPLGGCLPVLIQMPIYIALYSMLGNAVELYRAPFLWVHDLTSPDPFYIMPILTGALMFLQQKTQPTPADPNQKVMMYTMPVMFTVFNLVWPAGLTIYILTNTILTFLQQWLMNRGDKPARPNKAASTKPARA